MMEMECKISKIRPKVIAFLQFFIINKIASFGHVAEILKKNFIICPILEKMHEKLVFYSL